MYKKLLYIISSILIVCFLLLSSATTALASDYYRIAILSDLHLPYSRSMFKLKDKVLAESILAAKHQAISDINNTQDIDLVAIIGDVVGTNGSPSEFAYAAESLAILTKPTAPILGNHDLMYGDIETKKHKYAYSSSVERQTRITAFKKLFNIGETYYTKQAKGYTLIFLSPDVLDISVRPILLSDKQLNWLDDILSKNKQPAIIFCHAPLEGTFTDQDLPYNDPSSEFVKPANQLAQIIKKHPQVTLWVSGHLHMLPDSPSFKCPQAFSGSQVINIHNPDLNHSNIYTRSLYLYKNKIVVKTFNHKTQAFVGDLELTIPLVNKR